MSSNLTRSTTTFQTLTVSRPAKNVITGVQLESKTPVQHGQPWAPCGFCACPRSGLRIQCGSKIGHHGQHFSRLVFAGDDENIWFPNKDVAHPARWRCASAGPDTRRCAPRSRRRSAWCSVASNTSYSGGKPAGLGEASRCDVQANSVDSSGTNPPLIVSRGFMR